MYDNSKLSKVELECLDMFKLFDAGAHELALLKTHVKQWEYLLYGGRPEVYPEDRKAMLTLLEFKRQRIEKEKKRDEAKQRMQERMRGNG